MNTLGVWAMWITGAIILAPFVVCAVAVVAQAWTAVMLKAWDILMGWTDGD